jgi:hypothetical protein
MRVLVGESADATLHFVLQRESWHDCNDRVHRAPIKLLNPETSEVDPNATLADGDLNLFEVRNRRGRMKRDRIPNDLLAARVNPMPCNEIRAASAPNTSNRTLPVKAAVKPIS